VPYSVKPVKKTRNILGKYSSWSTTTKALILAYFPFTGVSAFTGDAPMTTKFKHLLSPITIGPAHVKNRIVMAPMNTGFAGPNGEVTQRMVDYYEERAKHGVGLIVVEATGVVADVKNMACQPCLADESCIPGFATLVERIKAYGAITVLQIQHSGNEAAFGKLVSASDVSSKVVGGVVTPLTVEEIEDLIEQFIRTAGRAQTAGFDGVEVHAAHGYLLNQFLSPFFNRRTDIYGGSIENRARMIVSIIDGIKSRFGEKFVVSVRYSAKEYIDGGLDMADSIQFATLFQAAGAHSLHVTSGVYDSALFISGPASVPQGMFVPTARAIKQAVDIPVIVVGRINDPLFAEEVLQDGSADMVAFGRAFLADHAFPLKIYEDRLDEIQKCIGCKYCATRVGSNLDVRCMVNAATGRERYFSDKASTAEPKKVAVVGGGPAGTQAAISAKRLGHDVTLLERTNRLGGQLNLAAKPPFKGVHHLLNYQKNTIKALGIEVKFGEAADRASIELMEPDVVIVATGAKAKAAPCPTIDCGNLISAWEALAVPEKVGKKVVIIGGGSVGCETAEFLAGRQVQLELLGMKGQGPDVDYRVVHKESPDIARDITIIELLDDVACDEEMHNLTLFKIRLQESDIRIITGARTEEIRKDMVVYRDNKTQEMHNIKADTVIISTGVEPQSELLVQLSALPFRVLAVGDCVEPGRIKDAVYQGALAAYRI
jgi:2,4-dienoyl-CoA reductase-like NADH-dependent reductase (Old Yellow Enzyme family)/thioredoxin reductase